MTAATVTEIQFGVCIGVNAGKRNVLNAEQVQAVPRIGFEVAQVTVVADRGKSGGCLNPDQQTKSACLRELQKTLLQTRSCRGGDVVAIGAFSSMILTVFSITLAERRASRRERRQ